MLQRRQRSWSLARLYGVEDREEGTEREREREREREHIMRRKTIRPMMYLKFIRAPACDPMWGNNWLLLQGRLRRAAGGRPVSEYEGGRLLRSGGGLEGDKWSLASLQESARDGER